MGGREWRCGAVLGRRARPRTSLCRKDKRVVAARSRTRHLSTRAKASGGRVPRPGLAAGGRARPARALTAGVHEWQVPLAAFAFVFSKTHCLFRVECLVDIHDIRPFWAFFLVAIACSSHVASRPFEPDRQDGDGDARRSRSAPARRDAASRPPVPARSGAVWRPETGRWSVCSVEQEAGASVTPRRAARAPWPGPLRVTPSPYMRSAATSAPRLACVAPLQTCRALLHFS